MVVEDYESGISEERARAARQVEVASAEEEERIFVATQWQLMWWRFRRHKLAVASAFVLSIFYVVGATTEFLSSSNPALSNVDVAYLRPQKLNWFDGGFSPYVNGIIGKETPRPSKRSTPSTPRPRSRSGFSCAALSTSSWASYARIAI